MAPTDIDTELLEAAVRSRGTPALMSLNQGALKRFRETGLPTSRVEDWKYTSLDSVAAISNAWLAGLADADASETNDVRTEPPDGIEATWIRMSGDTIDDACLRAANKAFDGRAEISRLSAHGDNSGIFLENAIASLNGTLIGDALCLTVRKNATLDRPVGILLDDRADNGPAASHYRLLIFMEDNSNAEIIEFHRSSGEADHYATVIAELELGRGARAGYVKIQERSSHHVQVGQVHANIGRDATFNHAAIDLGAKMIRNDVLASIASPGAHFTSAGLSLAEDGQHIDNHIAADHRVGPATSSQNYRCIASGRSRCVFNGKAIVREGADGTDAEQSNHSLLLSDLAEIDTKPELEIYAEDVKCAHGATVGQLDEKALFYLRSRGLDKEQAAQMLTRAFASSVLDQLSIEAVRSYLGEATDRKLDKLVEVREG